ncbi:hypothetical protein FRZ06_13575 [Anoxybacterium hadale]|uniref:Uncharacterized protein n=1 Tax=Anoxybacterium hadale TaxID=3408580 RepID=A0ACD1ADD9_9FIRM|nr:hypothetical protein FRZ06_13575 [Clostridiales bacterium]
MNGQNEIRSAEVFASKMFDAVLQYARVNDKAFRENISEDYHATLLASFYMIYGVDLINYFILNRDGQFNKDISSVLFDLMTERIESSFSPEEAEMIKNCVSVMEDEIIKALALPFDHSMNNPFHRLAKYIPTIIDIRGEYNKLYADQLLFNCLSETFAGLGRLVNKQGLN